MAAPTTSPPGLRWPCDRLPEPVLAGRFRFDDRGFPYSYRGPTHALHIYEYSGTWRLDGVELGLRPGDATVTAAGSETRYDLPDPGHHWCVHFRPLRGAPHAEAALLPALVHCGPARTRLVSGIQRIAGLLAAPAAESDLARATARAVLLDLLLTMALIGGRSAWIGSRRPEQDRALRSTAAVQQAAALIDGRLEAPLSASAIARRVGLSPNWLARAFRAHFGTTMAGYLLSRRIELAQSQLRGTDLPVARIAERLGFSDVQHLNKQFRRVVGVSPSAWRLRGRGD
ncbi:hypothetical protein LBMAG53_09690 [Planctomycetota bacterium]|nr:hypothetical protein LBMAG53_09690 [Planctomycetota bacterium]